MTLASDVKVIGPAGVQPVNVVGVLPVYVIVTDFVASGDTTTIEPDDGNRDVSSTVNTPAANEPLVCVEYDAPTPIAPLDVLLADNVRCPIIIPE